ncbi:MAG: nicotinate (nicotinamide) nucleotide adenylyltransferase [Planctomycetes bacterium]|nr:nicotinate (nicotinamide) nucleotide adenylyltransferase [Planctomycetota bacterium]
MAAGANGADQQGSTHGVGVLGGSFNPPHATHLRLCREALARLPIDRLLVIPAGDHPHKRGRDMAPAEDRLAMCRLAFGDLPGVTVDDRELRRRGPSFTVDTLAELRAELHAPLFFLIGSDNLPLLPTWHEHHRLLQLASVVTWPRRGHAIDAATLRGLDLRDDERDELLRHVLDVDADEVAASDLRQRLRAGGRPLPELSPAVLDYIERRGLYR